MRLGVWRAENHRAWSVCARHAVGREARWAAAQGRLKRTWRGTWELEGASWIGLAGPTPVGGTVVLTGAIPGDLPGDEIVARGPTRCRIPARNPARVAEPSAPWASPRFSIAIGPGRTERVRRSVGLGTRLANRVSVWLDRTLAPAPGIRGLARAVWLGDVGALPPSLVDWYREGGLLPVLALSGQHVAVLAACLALSLRALVLLWLVGGGSPRAAQALAAMRWTSTLGAAALLTVTSQGASSMRRTLAMATALALLRWRRLHCDPVQLATSAAAIAIAMEPGLVATPGFLLSAVGTVTLLRISEAQSASRGLGAYVVVSVAVTLAMLPVTAYYFGKAALASPVTALVVGSLWSVLLLPGAFAVPVGLSLMPEAWRDIALRGLESGWRHLVALHEPLRGHVERTYVAVARPDAVETAAIEIALVAVVVAAQRAWLGADTRTSSALPFRVKGGEMRHTRQP